MEKLYPKKNKLKKGDCIGILACTGEITDTSELINAKKYFEKLGLSVKISETAFRGNERYFCASDADRANALNEFFSDESVDAIILARGGYGSIRILDKIDYEAVKNNPKIFCGYSDITALSLILYKKTGLITYNAPMAIPDFGTVVDKFTENSFINYFFDYLDDFQLPLYNMRVFKKGCAQGILWGGNLSTVQSLCGTDFIPDEKFIFVTEDVNEPVYKIDKMLTQLLNIPEFSSNLSGIVLGDFSNIDNKIFFEKLFFELGEKLNIPIVSGLKFGHEKQKLTFPIGMECILDTKSSKIAFT